MSILHEVGMSLLTSEKEDLNSNDTVGMIAWALRAYVMEIVIHTENDPKRNLILGIYLLAMMVFTWETRKLDQTMFQLPEE